MCEPSEHGKCQERRIDHVIAEIQRQCEYLLTSDQLKIIKEEMIEYAFSAMLDSKVRNELKVMAEEIVEQDDNA